MPVVTTSAIEKSQVTALTTITTTTISSVKTTTTTPSISMAIPSASVSQPFIKLIKLPSTQQLPSPSSSSSAASLNNDCHNNQEQIVEKAKQEAYVMQRITELQRDGLWTEKRLPKIQEPTRTKAHWDYLLEEMVWLAADFAQERKWKKATAKKCAKMVQKHFQDKAIQAQKAEKLQELRLKKIAGFVAKEIKTFWSNVEKVNIYFFILNLYPTYLSRQFQYYHFRNCVLIVGTLNKLSKLFNQTWIYKMSNLGHKII